MIFNIYKPIGWTSFDVVKKVRNITGKRKVGHGGTLDPFAVGVLIIATNSDTKKLGEISGSIKSYRAVLQLGEQTDTLDLDGKVIASKPVPTLDKNLVESVLKHFIGKYKQIPPMYSAKKVNGVRLYKLARKNKTINREPVEVNIIDLTLNDIHDKQIDFSVTCSKGTYIRVLGQEIAKKLGTEGHLTKLQRIAVGDFVVQDSIPLKEFEAKWMSTEH
jgi:tRNA pseudouridine55 synthase